MYTQNNIAVVMSVLNGEKFLSAAVESILRQTFPNFTFIIIDNGSVDGTTDILKKYEKEDKRIRIIRNSIPLTLVEARMQGISATSAEWVALMDADDISEPDRLEKQLSIISQYGDRIGAVGTWARYINENGEILGERVAEPVTLEKFQELFETNEAIALVDPSAVIHRPTFLQIGGYRPEYTPAADLDLWYRIAETGRAILVVPEFLLRYRVHLGSDSVRKTMQQRQKTHFINYNMRRRRSGLREISWDEYLSRVWASPRYRIPRLRTDLAMTLYKRAGLFYGAHRYGMCAANLIGAGLLNPRFVFKRIVLQKLPAVRKVIDF